MIDEFEKAVKGAVDTAAQAEAHTDAEEQAARDLGNTGGMDDPGDRRSSKTDKDQWGDNRMGVPPGDGDATEADDKGYDTAASKEGVPSSSRGKRTAKPSSATEKKDGAGVVNLDDDTHEL